MDVFAAQKLRRLVVFKLLHPSLQFLYYFNAPYQFTNNYNPCQGENLSDAHIYFIRSPLSHRHSLTKSPVLVLTIQ